jgi:hypothetical protein
MDWIPLAQNGTGGWLLWTQKSILGLHETRRDSWLAMRLSASQEGLRFVEIATFNCRIF